MSRSLKKGPFIDYKLEKKIQALSSEDRTVVLDNLSRDGRPHYRRTQWQGPCPGLY